MRWVAPSEKDTANETLGRRLRAAANQLRAESGLNLAQYSAPVFGRIFLRFAEAGFAESRAGFDMTTSASKARPLECFG